jgi:hypothetical protein
VRRNQAIQLEPADHFQDGFDMAMRKGFLGGQQILGRDQALVPQQAAEGFDFFPGANRKDWPRSAGGFCWLRASLRAAGRRAGNCGWE